MFVILSFVKIFHWLVQDRVDFIETTPNVSRLQHARIVTFTLVLLVRGDLRALGCRRRAQPVRMRAACLHAPLAMLRTPCLAVCSHALRSRLPPPSIESQAVPE